MSQAEFKAEVRARGWTYTELAKRWGVSPGYIGKLARAPQRSLHWDDAVRGLPLVVVRRR